MSVGKNSIARAVTATASAPARIESAPVAPVTAGVPVAVDTIQYLSGAAATSADIASAPLLTSIRKRGMLIPVLLARGADGTLWVLDGYRRLDAARTLALSHIPATLVDVNTEREAILLMDELHAAARGVQDVREGKFRAAALMDHDMPSYLL